MTTDQQLPDDIAERLAEINEIYGQASQFKTAGRRSAESFDAYKQAAEKYHEAAIRCRDLLSIPHLDASRQAQVAVFVPYYFYEAERSLMAWHYERRETNDAHAHLSKASDYLTEHIKELEHQLPSAEGDLATRLTACLTKATFFKQSDTLVFGSITARAAWDRGDFIAALDEYRRMAPKYKMLVEQASTLEEAVYYRISLGNYLSMSSNASAAMAKHIADIHGVPGVFPHDLACGLIRCTLDSYRAGMKGFYANPEWHQYRDAALMCQQNVEQFLKDNKGGWAEIYADLHDDIDLVKAMARLDLPMLKRLTSGGAEARTSHDTLLSRESLLKRITLALSMLQVYVESINRLRLLDANVVSESFFGKFLSAMFELSLANLNTPTANQAAIDLGDKEAKECVQVTSDGSKKKARKTLDTFRAHGLGKEYDRLRIVIIGNRVGKYDDLQSASAPIFDPDSDVLGIPELVGRLAAHDTETLRRLVEIIDCEMPAVRSPLATMTLVDTQIVGGKGSLGPGGDARVKGPKGGKSHGSWWDN